MSNDDALYSDEFKDIITNFCKIVSTNAYVKDISVFIEVFRRSRVLDVLLNDPHHSGAKTCVASFLADNPTLPGIFLSRFLAIANARIHAVPVRMGASMSNSCVVSVVPTSVKPPLRITNLTANAIRDRLREDTRNVRVNQASRRNIASRVRLHFTPQLLNQLINSMIGMHRLIDEGNRQNGYQMSSYVRMSHDA